jgi:hypothetical protein
MAFIKIGNIVINTSHIATVNLEAPDRVTILMAASTGENNGEVKVFRFSDEEAQQLRAYFRSPNDGVDLLESKADIPELSSRPNYYTRNWTPPQCRPWGSPQPDELEFFTPPSLFIDFTPESLHAIRLAREEARRLRHSVVGTELLLLGLIGEETGVAAKVFKSIGITIQDARMEVESLIGRGLGAGGLEIHLSRRAKRVLELAREADRHFETIFIGTEHLLLGLIQLPESVASSVFMNLGVNREHLHALVLRMVKE